MTSGKTAGSPRGQGGLTLIEILIALVVVGFGVGLFLKMQSSAGARLHGSSQMLQAGQIVEKHMEAMRITIAQGNISSWPPQDTAYVENRLSVSRRVSQAISPKTGDVLANVRKVDLSVAWGKRPIDSLRISTYVAKQF
ncbi:MAG TPA: prepilin-type N-terminal cleavage/methylation domain-containing protein [Fibrobacteria bacterium]|nr:prepilin-type N-terminal cleavage/methylation domain-containing protein [Fibrobacteria bacterium]